MNENASKTYLQYISGRMSAYLQGIIGIDAVLSSVKDAGPEFFAAPNLEYIVKNLKESSQKITRPKDYQLGQNYDLAISPLASRMVYCALGNLSAADLSLYINQMPKELIFKKENFAAVLDMFCNEFCKFEKVEVKSPNSQKLSRTYSPEEEKDKIASLMVVFAANYKKIGTLAQNPNSELYKTVFSLRDKFHNLPQEFFSQENVNNILDLYYGRVSNLLECKRKDGESLTQFASRVALNEKTLKKDGVYDDVDDVASILILAANNRNHDIGLSFCGLSQEHPITLDPPPRADGKQ